MMDQLTAIFAMMETLERKHRRIVRFTMFPDGSGNFAICGPDCQNQPQRNFNTIDEARKMLQSCFKVTRKAA